MQLPDVNVLIYAHREDAPEHERYAAWLQATVAPSSRCHVAPPRVFALPRRA